MKLNGNAGILKLIGEIPRDQQIKLSTIGTKGKTYFIPTPAGITRFENQFGESEEFFCAKDFFNQKVRTKDTPKWEERLRDYQIEDCNFLYQRNAAANFSEPRTGKTPTALQVANALNQKTVIVCPQSIQKMSWYDKIEEWTDKKAVWLYQEKSTRSGELKHFPIPKHERLKVYHDFFTNDDTDFLIVSKDTWKIDYDLFFKEEKSIKKPFTLIVDEAHFFRNHHSITKTTKQCKAIMALRKYATNVYALTGTPSANHPSDIWGILNLLFPQTYKSYYDFCSYFWGLETRYYKPREAYRSLFLEEDLVSLVGTFSVMHKRKEVMKWLPPILKEVVEVDMLGEQRDAYFNYFTKLKYGDDYVSDPLSHIGKLRIVSNGWVDKNRNIKSGKGEFIRQYLKDNETEKILVLSFYSEKTIPLIAELLEEYNPQILTGKNKEDLPGYVAKIQNSSEHRLFLANTQVIKEGLTLDKIDTIIFMDRMFNPDDNQQAEARFLPTVEDDLRGHKKQIIDLISTVPVDFSRFSDIIRERLLRTLTDKKILEMLSRKENITKYLNNLGKHYEYGGLE
jgi:SNF2 family DNA or RNA helicase